MSASLALFASAPRGRLCVAVLLLGAGAAVAQTRGKSYFFATREACVASGVFRKGDCANAFANAREDLRARGLAVASRIDCVLQYHECERRGDGRYAPAMLGVEMALTDKGGGVAAPTLAVETPRGLFPPRSTARLYVAPPPAPKAPASAAPAPEEFTAQAPDPIDAAYKKGGDRGGETLEQRRERLRSAPFIR